MNTGSNGGLGFGARINLDGLRRDAEQLKKELKMASLSGSDSMERLSRGAIDAVKGMAARVRIDIQNTERDINSLSKKIVQQASLIKDVEMDVSRRKDTFNRSFGTNKTAAFGEWQAAKRALEEERAALAGLTTQRANDKIKLTELKQEQREYNEVLKQSTSLKRDFTSLLAKIGGVYALKRLGQEIIDVRGEMQMLSISFATLLNSKEKADKLMAQLTNTVLSTPLQLTELAQGAKQLLAFGFQAERVNDTLVMLGNVAKGLTIPLSEMVYLYGTTMTEGRLFAKDMRQFTSRGIPLAEELAKQFGVTKEKVSDLVSAGKIGFPEVEKALASMTSEGGRFYNLMQEQVKSIPGQLSNLQDSLTMQLNKIGGSMEGTISAGISATKLLVDNLDVLGKMLVSSIATLGVYRTAVLIATIAQNSWGLSTLTQIGLINNLIARIRALNAAMLANPYAAAAAAIVALVGVMWAFSDSTTASEKAQKSLNETLEKNKTKRDEMVSEVQKLLTTIRSETSSVYETVKAYDELIKRYSFFAKYKPEDLKKMTDKEIQALYSSFNQKTEKEQTQGNYDNKLKELQSLQSRLDEAVKQQAVSPSGQKASLILSLKEDIEKAKNEAEGYKKQLEEIARLEKEAANARKEEVTKDKSYWEKQKKDAQETLDQLDREAYNKLEAGIRKGIDQKTIDIYTKNAAIRDEAERMLSTKKNTKEGDKVEKANQDIKDRAIASELELQKAKIELMAEGREREIEEIRLATAKKIVEITKEEEAIKKAYKEAKKKMTPEESASFDARRGIATSLGQSAETRVNAKYSKEIAEKEKELADIFLTENERKIAGIKDRYDAERKWANELFGSGGMTQDQYNSFINLIDSAETEAHLADFKEKYKTVADQITDIEKQAALDRARATTDAQRGMIDDWEKTQKSKIVSQDLMKDGSFTALLGNLDRLGTGKISDALTKAKEKLKAAQDSGTYTPTDLKTFVDAVEKGEAEVRQRNPFKALSEAIKEYKKQPKGEKDITDIARSAAEGFRLVEGSLSAVVDGLKKMGIAGDEETQELLGSLVELAGSAAELAEGIASKNPVMIIKGAIGVITSMFNIFDKRSRDAQREIRKHEEAVKALQSAYKALEQEIKKAFSTDYYKKQIDQAANLEQQIQRIYAMIAAEESKRKRKQDQEKIEGWRNEIADLKSQAADIRRAVMDELMTTDLRSFSSQLASSVIQGYSEGMTDLESVVQGSVDDLMRKMITKQYDVLVAQKALKPLFDAIEGALNVDNGDFSFSPEELANIRNIGLDMKGNLLAAGNSFRELLGDLGLVNTGERQGVAKGIAQASQQSVDALGGTATTIMGHTFSISQETREIKQELNMLLRHVMSIDTNTRRLETIERDMSAVREGIEMINIKGVVLR